MTPATTITCIGCGGIAHLLSYAPADEPGEVASGWEEGDVVSYRCGDCGERWDLVLGTGDDETEAGAEAEVTRRLI